MKESGDGEVTAYDYRNALLHYMRRLVECKWSNGNSIKLRSGLTLKPINAIRLPTHEKVGIELSEDRVEQIMNVLQDNGEIS
mmetsp:Transcript_12083/g.18673  ORF Transcript_12083/g.18673 Transcript_12083/m.18673 type:complete len:82 (-) Transcript_12083:1255-1500(-)